MENKIRCVSYVDHYSISQSSLRDLEIGHRERIVGCNSSVFGASKSNDFVIINATHHGKKYAVIGILKEKLDFCNLWQRHGGNLWKYNYTYVSLTDIFEVTTEVKERIAQYCAEDENKPNPSHLIHSRFCGIRYKNVILKLVTYITKFQ